MGVVGTVVGGAVGRVVGGAVGGVVGGAMGGVVGGAMGGVVGGAMGTLVDGAGISSTWAQMAGTDPTALGGWSRRTAEPPAAKTRA